MPLTDHNVWIIIAFVISALLAVRNLLKNGIVFPRALVMVLASFYGGLLGARVVGVLLTNSGLLFVQPHQLLVFWQGGHSWLGALPGGLFIFFVAAKTLKQRFWISAGAITPALPLGLAIGRVGCFMAGCCYGRPTDLFWGIYSARLGRTVHPTQVYDLITEFFVFVFLQWLFEKRPASCRYLAPLYGAIYAFHRFFQEFWRGAPAGPALIGGLRVFQSACLIIFIVSLIIILILRSGRKSYVMALFIGLITVWAFILFRPVHLREFMDALSNNNPSGIYLIATRDIFMNTIEHWRTYLESKGFQVFIKAWKKPPSEMNIQEWVIDEMKGKEIEGGYILLVGDCAGNRKEAATWHIPSRTLVINKRQVGVDSRYGDIDKDGRLDIPVGRWPVRSLNDLKIQILKRKTYDNVNKSLASRRVVVWIGDWPGVPEVKSFASRVADRILPKGMTLDLISDGRPNEPVRFIEAIQTPSLLSVIAAHGSWRSVTTSHGRQKAGLTIEDIGKIESNRPASPLIILGCDAGRVCLKETENNSLSRELIRYPGGSIVVLAPSTQIHPWTNLLAAVTLSKRLELKPSTVGELVMGLWRVSNEYSDGAALSMSASLDKNGMSSVRPPAALSNVFKEGGDNQEILSFQLLGDPATPLVW